MHLLKVESISTVTVLRVDPDAAPIVRQRAVEVKGGMAPVAAMQSYRRINQMLDRQIVALCKMAGVSTLYAMDKSMRSFAEGAGMKVVGIHELPPARRPAALDGSDSERAR